MPTSAIITGYIGLITVKDVEMTVQMDAIRPYNHSIILKVAADEIDTAEAIYEAMTPFTSGDHLVEVHADVDSHGDLSAAPSHFKIIDRDAA